MLCLDGSSSIDRIESESSPGAAAEPHRAELVGVLIDEIATYAEAARDRRGIDQFDVGGLPLKEISDSSSHGLYLRFRQAQSPQPV